MDTSHATSAPLTLHIGIPGFTYADLYEPSRLRELTEIFYGSIRSSDPALWERFDHYRTTLGEGMKPEEISAVIVDTAPHLSAFITELFQVEDVHGRWRRAVEDDAVVFVFKREFVVRRALKKYPSVDALDYAMVRRAAEWLRDEIFAETYADTDAERATAIVVVRLMNLEKSLKTNQNPEGELARELSELLDLIERKRDAAEGSDAEVPSAATPAEMGSVVTALIGVFEQWIALEHSAPSELTRGWISMRHPHTLDFSHLVDLRIVEQAPAGTFMGPPEHLRPRDGFKLTDARGTHRELIDDVEYCIYCHNRDKDSCSKGLREKDGSIKRNPLGIMLNGCPLNEKISEMHTLKHSGDGLASLSVIMIDNPMCPGTGHRICNDCMKACIYQKQDPVNIPHAETGALTEVLSYPFGFEIYSLLTRWNPLNVHRPHALPYNGRKVLVVGLGPAGYTLSHYLTNEGFGVVGVDGLKIEPLPARWVGGKGMLPEPIADFREIYDQLDDRVVLGFGGVSEYGITVRWDKNFLKVIYIALARRRTFRIYGAVRFGGTITIDDAWKLGFDHVAIATGAGKPTIVSMKNNLLRGIRQASDFLMALQLTGAFKPGAISNLQMRLPAIVVGGGLTGIDTTTEAMAYYPVQVEGVLDRSEVLRSELGDEAFWNSFNEEEREIIEEFIEHGKAIRQERRDAASQERAPNFIDLIRAWGGVSLVYRKSINDSPAYRLNHEEVIKALEEGIYVIENLSPVEAVADHHGAVAEIIFERQQLDDTGKWRGSGELVGIPARSVMIAAGTSPNTIIERENAGAFAYDDWHQFFAPFVAAPAEAAEQVA